jgi:hypothetical protein
VSPGQVLQHGQRDLRLDTGAADKSNLDTARHPYAGIAEQTLVDVTDLFDGRWLLENTHPGAVHFRFEEPDGTPSRWNTLRALRVLRWYDASAHSGSVNQAS